jgi:hypothetical protein
MTSVVCFADDCKWCSEIGECQRGAITINGAWECEGFESYRDSYTDSFWVCCLKEGEKYRRFRPQGKKVEYNGYLFYTQDKITDSGNYFLTEARTGIGVCRFNELEKRWDKFVERVGDYPDVMTLPIESEGEG